MKHETPIPDFFTADLLREFYPELRRCVSSGSESGGPGVESVGNAAVEFDNGAKKE